MLSEKVSTVFHIEPSTCIVQYQHLPCDSGRKVVKNDHLTKMYSRQKIIPKNTWPPVGAGCYINLVLIRQSGEMSLDYDYSVKGDNDDIIKHKEPVDYDKLFAKFSEGSLVLVEGRPGSGKSTLVHKLVRDWAITENILSGAEIVLLVPLRLLNRIDHSHTLTDLLALLYWDPSELESVSTIITKSQGKGVCFIFDGLDEYGQQDCIAQSSVRY